MIISFQVSGYGLNLKNKKIKAELRNLNFTILSSECAEGVLYYKLELQILSLTINFSVKSENHLNF